METEFPRYDSCQPCETLKPVKTQIGEGWGCPVCQMTYIRVEKGAFIPFDQAMKLFTEKRRREQEKAKLQAKRQKMRAKPKRKRRR